MMALGTAMLALPISLTSKTIYSSISSKNLHGDRHISEVEMSIDFVSENDSNIMELQPIVAPLKSQLKINSASCTYLSPEIVGENKQVSYRVE